MDAPIVPPFRAHSSRRSSGLGISPMWSSPKFSRSACSRSRLHRESHDAGAERMRVYQFTEQPYPQAWNDHNGSLRVNLPNRKVDPNVAADLFHRYYDEWLLADELGLDIMLNEHHQTATCMCAAAIVPLSILARQTRR